MRQVYKGNVSVPLHVIQDFLGMNDSKSIDPKEAAEKTAALLKSLREAVKNIENGLDKSNLTVCVGKGAYVDPHDMRRFMSREIPRLTIYPTSKENHSMPLYVKMKPEHYIHRAKKKKAAQQTKGKRHGRN
jgi:hypothetical protein